MIIGSIAIMVFVSAVLAQETYLPFLSLARDIPLAPGLVEKNERAVIFDKPQGRIIRMVAQHQEGRQEGRQEETNAAVKAYYQAILPNLGWIYVGAEGDLRFQRDGEALTIILNNNAPEIVFEITPLKPKSY